MRDILLSVSVIPLYLSRITGLRECRAAVPEMRKEPIKTYMKFTISSTALLARLQSVSRVIASKNAISILDNILFELNAGKLKVTASDSETTMETYIDVNESDCDGAFTVSGKSILDVLREIPEQPISIEVNTETFEMKVNYMNGVLSLVGQNPLEYPKTPEIVRDDQVVDIVIPAPVLLNGIAKTQFATDNNEFRATMNGIYFDITTEDITMVASDGHKLVRCKTLAAHGSERAAFILPKEENDVKVTFNSRNAVFAMSDYVLTCRLTEGRYPNYNSVIPKNPTNKITIDRGTLLGALRRVSICSLQSGGLIRWTLGNPDFIKMSGQDFDFSFSGEETVPCSYDGVEMEIGFNSSFLIEMLQNMDSEQILIELVDQTRAGIITPLEQEADEDLLMLLTPMML